MYSTTTPFTKTLAKQIHEQSHQSPFKEKAARSITAVMRFLIMCALLGSVLPARADGGGCAAPSFAPVVTYSSGGSTVYSVAAADFNGDGKADLAATNYNSNTVGVRLNNGNGTFGPVVTYPSGGSNPYSVAAGDFNGDGKADLAVTNYNSNTVAVLINNGSGAFAAAVTYGSGGDSPGSVAAADFTGDGKADLAVTNYYSANVAVLINNGSGVFAAAVTYASGGSNPNSIAAADFTGDGKADLVAANYSSGNVRVLLNNGSGVFTVLATYASGNPDPIAVTAADFTGDGKADIAAAHFNSSTIGVLLNNGSGVFGAAALYGSGGNGPYSVGAGDFNGDGKTDLVAANYSANTAGVLLNNGSGVFAAAVAFSSGGNNAYSVAVADFNADGKPDLAVANHITATIGVLINTCNSCPAIVVSIPDAKALPYGVQPNTVYIGYAPASSITLKANVIGGTGPYKYTWSTGSTSSSIKVSPNSKTEYKVSVLDANNCPSNKDSITICVEDVRADKNGRKVYVSYKIAWFCFTIAVKVSEVENLLKCGAMLGKCPDECACAHVAAMAPMTAGAVDSYKALAENEFEKMSVKVLSNPTYQYFTLNLTGGDPSQRVQLRVLDFYGRLVEQKNNLTSNQSVRLGASYSAGIYFAEIWQGKQKTVVKLMKR